MRMKDLIGIGKEYLAVAVILCTALIVLFLLGYHVIYRKAMKDKKRIRTATVLWCVVMLIYLFVVAGATLLSRGSIYGGRAVSPLFSSYREAYIMQKPVLWRNLILNYLMFVPLGFLLPTGVKHLRTAWKTYIAGFIFSLLIELTQLLMHRGIFEPDDLLANTVGCMIGYGIYLIGKNILIKEGRKKLWQVIAAQIPLISVSLSFLILWVCYAGQELGNNQYQAYEAMDTSTFELEGVKDFDEKTQELMVYKVSLLTVDEAERKGREYFHSLGMEPDESRTDIYDETIVLYDSDGRHSLWIDYLGGIMRYMDFDSGFSERRENGAALKASEEEVRSALSKLQIELPPAAVFTEIGNGRYRFVLNIYDDGINRYDGFLECFYSEGGVIGEFVDHRLLLTPYKAFPALSRQEAYKKIKQGKFTSGMTGGFARIVVQGVRTEYSIDTKGYYQPDYCFECMIGDEEVALHIPALR